MNILLDPKIFNYTIMALYIANIARWSIHGSWVDTWYWFSALSITAAVTWGYGR